MVIYNKQWHSLEELFKKILTSLFTKKINFDTFVMLSYRDLHCSIRNIGQEYTPVPLTEKSKHIELQTLIMIQCSI